MSRKRRKENENKMRLIAELIQEYNVKSALDLQNALKDLLGETLETMLETEMEEHLGYEEYERSDNENSRNGYKEKKVISSFGEKTIKVPQDRDSSFEPQVVKKRQKDISRIEEQIISMYAMGMTTRQISDQINEIYGFEASPSLISNITDKVVPQIEEWQNRPLDELYPVIYIDAIHFSVKDEGAVVKKAAYIVLGISETGYKDVLGIYIGQNESAKFWLSVLNHIKARGVEDIFIICSDALSGIKESINTAFPKACWQRCIVHQVRNTLKYVSYKNKKEFANDLKTIYHAIDEPTGYEKMERVKEKWDKIYPMAMDSWVSNWDSIAPIFNYSAKTRKIIYTTNAIESLNSSYRRLNKSRPVFPSDSALLKTLYLATTKIIKKWTTPIRDWGQIIGELKIMADYKGY